MMLYGFPTRDERDTFEALIAASGVGPKLALAILSVHTPHEPAALPRRRRLDALVARARRRQAHRAAAARRAEGAARGARPRPHRGRRVARRRTPAAEVRDALVGPRLLAPTRCATCSASSPTTAPSKSCCATRSATRWPGRDDGRSMREELLSPEADPAEVAEETTLRPRRLDEFVGQPRLREHLEIMLTAAKQRGQAVDHVLLAGPPGLGKTSLAGHHRQRDGRAHQPTSGPALERAGDLAAILTNLDDGDVLFIDEVHRLPRVVEESLYPAMEDFRFDIVIGKGPSARTIRLDLPRFTLVGAPRRAPASSPDRCATASASSPASTTTRPTSSPRSCAASRRSSASSSSPTAPTRSRAARRGTPRIANRLLKRVRDYAEVRADGRVTADTARDALGAVRGRRARPRQGRPRDPRRAVPHVRRPRGRARHARGRGGRGAGDRRRRVRAVPPAVRPASSARPAAGSRPRRASRTSVCTRPRAPGEAPELF